MAQTLPKMIRIRRIGNNPHLGMSGKVTSAQDEGVPRVADALPNSTTGSLCIRMDLDFTLVIENSASK